MSIAEKILRAKSDYDAVYEAGKAAGGGSGYDQGYIDGQIAEYDRFWEIFQQSGNKKGYYQAFANGHWTDDTYNPKYDIICKNGSASASSTFYNATKLTSTKVPIRITGIVATSMFGRCSSLETIPLLELNNVTGFSSTFSGCTALKNITIKGSIDVNFNISATAVLSDESVQSIIDHLKQLTPETTQTLTVHQNVRDKMTDAQVDKIVDQLKWTLAPAKRTGEV